VLRRGAVGEVLREQIATLKPDLLVVGTHGRTGVAGAVLGSVATGLLSDPPCDVLAVKAW
jgi:nucleotide-binding universal stress UspA family protein